MPRVPTYDTFQQTPAQFQPVSLQPASPRVDPGTQATNMGQAVQRLGQAVSDIERDTLKQANQVRVDDALNRALEAEMRLAYDKEAGYTTQRGLAALERKSGKMLADEYGEAFDKALDDIGAGLGNDYQRQVFAQSVAKRRTDFRANAMKHEADEFRTYTLSVREGTITNQVQRIGLNYANPQVIDDAIGSIRAATYDAATLQGRSATWADAQARKMVSNAHKTALMAALEKNDAAYADRYLKRYGKDMEADDLLQATGLITKEMGLRVGAERATEVMGRWAPKLVPGDLDRLTNIVLAMETNGRRYDADGKLIESPKGAKGEMQVLDGTNKAPGYGVKPAQDDSPEERARVGRDYLAAMVREHGGDVAKALAAYNWGPPRLDAALRQHGDAWLQHVPKETRNYVERGVREFGAGAGRGARPSLTEIKAELRADPLLAGNPAWLKTAEDMVERQYKEITAAEKQAVDEALDTAYRGLFANGGDLSALPVSVRALIPGDKLGAVMGFADTVRKSGGAVHRPEAWAQILSLPREDLAAMSPIEFFRAYRPVLDDAHLDKGYALLKEARGEAGADTRHLEVITTATRVKQGAIKAGILPATGKAKDSQIAEFAQFERLIDERVRQFEAADLQGKRKANSTELQQIIDGVLMDKVFVAEFGPDPQRIAGQLSLDQMSKAYVMVGDQELRVAQIPASQRAIIASKLQARGLPVTEQKIAETWAAAGRPQ